MFFLVCSNLLSAQQYDVMTDIIEQNPEYIIDEFYEIERDKKGKANLVLVVKSILNGSEKTTKTYYKGTPFFKDIEWAKATVKMPNQINSIEGYVSFNQVFQQIKFKRSLDLPTYQEIVPEYLTLDTLTLVTFPDDELLANGYYTTTSVAGLIVLKKHSKYQRNNPNQNLKGYVIDKPKFEAEFEDAPEFYVFKDEKTLRIEKDNYFYEAFGVDKKLAKSYFKKQKLNLKDEADVVLLLGFLSK
ncbi:hypothetical protein SAMN06298216_2445 [Spirosomataceae bacterium TFI 002]|nr:hypothetical protein SAMN06298216_2445 [Spirosomataceae bacterium TFI 002]